MIFNWNSWRGRNTRGGARESVAAKTTLGRVLLGSLKGEKFDSSPECSVNFLPCEPSAAELIGEQVNKLWNLDSLGIRPNNVINPSFLT